jgi:hypothetical protein
MPQVETGETGVNVCFGGGEQSHTCCDLMDVGLVGADCGWI